MDETADGRRVAASLASQLDLLTFSGLGTEQVTARIITATVGWAAGQGWRVYRRAPSVMRLPPPLSRQHSILDVACARPAGPPLAIEVDHSDRQRTVEKLLAEAAAGRIAIWVRWGTGRFTPPPPPVHMVTCVVSRHGERTGTGRVYSRTLAPDRPAPTHSTVLPGVLAPVELPLFAGGEPPPATPG